VHDMRRLRSIRRLWQRDEEQFALGATLRFALSGLAALVLASGVAAFALSRTGTQEAIREARLVTRVLAQGAIEPNLSDRLVHGDRDAIAAMDRIVRERVLKDPVARVKLWTERGRIVYSDEPRLIGSTYELEGDKREIFARGGEVAEKVEKLDEPENRYDRDLGEVLEVYVPVSTPSGRRLLLETYQHFGSVASSGRDIWFTFAPAALVALGLLWLAQLPLAFSLARRLEAGRAEREALLHSAIEASDSERRRIAADLHDSVVQDLAGVSFSLAATADRLESGSSDGSSGVVRQAAADTRESIRQLRSLLVEIHPPNLRSVGLAAALSDLAAPLVAQGIALRVNIPEDLSLAPETEELIYRVAREGLRNVKEHAAADCVTVSIDVREDRAVLLVEDDGRGFSAEELARRGSEGHMGIALLTQLVADQSGTLAVDSGVGRGTRMRLELPL
jgi:two-component system, NarL family, sensor kinase